MKALSTLPASTIVVPVKKGALFPAGQDLEGNTIYDRPVKGYLVAQMDPSERGVLNIGWSLCHSGKHTRVKVATGAGYVSGYTRLGRDRFDKAHGLQLAYGRTIAGRKVSVRVEPAPSVDYLTSQGVPQSVISGLSEVIQQASDKSKISMVRIFVEKTPREKRSKPAW